MKRLVANSSHFLDDFLEGFCLAHQADIDFHPNPLFLSKKQFSSKVAIVSGGGSGHEPLHAGFIGYGMLDAACPGQIFSAPTPEQILAAIKHCDQGQGTLLLVKNYSGDIMNFEIAAELSELPVDLVIIKDDISGNPSAEMGHRGIAGTIIVEKVVGAASEQGYDLAFLKALGSRVAERTHSLGVALTGATNPETGQSSFEVPDHAYEFGVGIHGERGWQTHSFQEKSELLLKVANTLLEHMDASQSPSLLVLVNGLGAVPLNELYILLKQFHHRVMAEGFHIQRTLVGNYATSLDMIGFSITVTELDDELTRLWDYSVRTPTLRW